MTSRALPVILLSILCSSTAHLFLKRGSATIGGSAALGSLLLRVAASGWLWAGLALHGLALVTWVYALSKCELSFAYPFIALGFVLTAVFAAVFMNEPLSPLRVIGMGFIVMGLLCVARG